MKKIFRLIHSILLAGSLVCPWTPARAAEQSGAAVLVMAPGGPTSWNRVVRRVVKGAQFACPYRIFLGNGDTPTQRLELQDLLQDLERRGADTIYVIPLLISSYSEIARQWKYLLGVDVQPGFMTHPLFPIEKRSTIRFMEPLNDSAVVVEVLLDRAQEISSDAAREVVIIVTYGPRDDSDHARWSQILQNLAARLRERGGYKGVEAVSLREDAPSPVRLQALQRLRDRVKAADRTGSRVLVVPLLLTTGGIEHKIGLELRGFNYAFNNKALLPDARVSEWIRSQVP